MLSFSISYPDLIKFPYFVDTTGKGDRGTKAEEIGGETEGDFTNNSNIHILFFSFWSIFENLEPEMG
jgi:hypothetical protein